mmetsp:Transcript_16948/g.48216  ORF Transcript_16948/g.48216 Transcript_16948/m.48216 type:complete len:305 (+) Transcript_16948:34-948(+)
MNAPATSPEGSANAGEKLPPGASQKHLVGSTRLAENWHDDCARRAGGEKQPFTCMGGFIQSLQAALVTGAKEALLLVAKCGAGEAWPQAFLLRSRFTGGFVQSLHAALVTRAAPTPTPATPPQQTDDFGGGGDGDVLLRSFHRGFALSTQAALQIGAAGRLSAKGHSPRQMIDSVCGCGGAAPPSFIIGFVRSLQPALTTATLSPTPVGESVMTKVDSPCEGCRALGDPTLFSLMMGFVRSVHAALITATSRASMTGLSWRYMVDFAAPGLPWLPPARTVGVSMVRLQLSRRACSVSAMGASPK